MEGLYRKEVDQLFQSFVDHTKTTHVTKCILILCDNIAPKRPMTSITTSLKLLPNVGIVNKEIDFDMPSLEPNDS